MEQFKDSLYKHIKNEKNICHKHQIDRNIYLYIDYRDKKLNLYIEDEKRKIFTQIISSDLALKIERKEANICNALENCIINDKQQIKDALVSTLIHSAYESKINNRGSPTVFGKIIDDDFDLDL